MRTFTIIPAFILIGQAAASLTTTTWLGDLCFHQPVGPTQTQTTPGVTITSTDFAHTHTVTELREFAVIGDTTFTEPPRILPRTPVADAELPEHTDTFIWGDITVVELNHCASTTTETFYPQTTFTDPHVTATATAWGTTSTVTVYSTVIY